MNARLKRIIRGVLSRGIHQYRIVQGPLKGSAFVTSLYDYPGAVLGTTERALLAWLRENVKSAETWLDVGAHYGYTAIAMARGVGSTGRVFAFEPAIATAGCIARTRVANGLTQITVVPLALGSESSLQIETLPTVRGMVDRTVRSTHLETFLVTSLDSLWPQISGTDRRIHGIKIDVQGAEILALRGMQKILSEMKPKLVVEFHEGVDRDAALEVLKTAGYRAKPVEIETGRSVGDNKILDNVSYAFV